jgi:GNAT superfamily N-acetyltransferase
MFDHTIRGYVPDDRNLILSSWLRENTPDPRVDGDVYFREQESKIKRWLLSLTFNRFRVLRVACAPDYPAQVFGWIAAELLRDSPVLHFVFVKGAFRGQGLAKELMEGIKPVLHTHEGRGLKRLKLASKFDPFAFSVE